MNTLVYVALGLAIVAIVLAIIAWAVTSSDDDCCHVDSIYLNMAPVQVQVVTGTLADFTDPEVPQFLQDYGWVSTPGVATQLVFTPDCDLKQIELHMSVENYTTGETNTLSNVLVRVYDTSVTLVPGTPVTTTITTSSVTDRGTGVAAYVFTDPLPAGTPVYVTFNVDPAPDTVITIDGVQVKGQIVGICNE